MVTFAESISFSFRAQLNLVSWRRVVYSSGDGLVKISTTSFHEKRVLAIVSCQGTENEMGAYRHQAISESA